MLHLLPVLLLAALAVTAPAAAKVDYGASCLAPSALWKLARSGRSC